MTNPKERLAIIIEERIRSEKKKHYSLDWIKIASLKITSYIIDRDKQQANSNIKVLEEIDIKICKALEGFKSGTLEYGLCLQFKEEIDKTIKKIKSGATKT